MHAYMLTYAHAQHGTAWKCSVDRACSRSILQPVRKLHDFTFSWLQPAIACLVLQDLA